MTWHAYSLVYRAMSPVHIGWHTLGYVNLTRHYIPGKNMWAAFTENATRASDVTGTTGYKKFGENVFNKTVLLSYFYPALGGSTASIVNPLLPIYTVDGLKYASNGDTGYSESGFERRFIKSYGQTAVVPHSKTAEDASLHESEFITPTVADTASGSSRVVCFVGYAFIRQDVDIDREAVGWDCATKNMKEIVSDIFVGGERKYGGGRLRLEKERSGPVVDSKAFGHQLLLDSHHLKMRLVSGEPIPAHLDVNAGLKLKGDIEPLVGREWGEITDSDGNKITGAGQKITQARVCWVPGSILEEDATLRIGPYGILEAEE